MISDVLFEAIEQIRWYQEHIPGAYDYIRPRIDHVVKEMKGLQTFLDTPPSEDKINRNIQNRKSLGTAVTQIPTTKAVRASESPSADILTNREVKEMDDVVERLRASRITSQDSEYRKGHACGVEWAQKSAETIELERISQLQDNGQLGSLLRDSDSAYSQGELLAFAIFPEIDGSRDEASECWEFIAGDDTSYNRSGWLRGFAEGALSVWDQVRDQ